MDATKHALLRINLQELIEEAYPLEILEEEAKMELERKRYIELKKKHDNKH